MKSTHRCWLEIFLGATLKKPKSCRDCLTNRHLLQFYCSTVRSFEIVFAGELFNSLCKRPSLYRLKPPGTAPVGAACPSDVQMMGRIMSRCGACSQIIATCFYHQKNEHAFLGKICWGVSEAALHLLNGRRPGKAAGWTDRVLLCWSDYQRLLVENKNVTLFFTRPCAANTYRPYSASDWLWHITIYQSLNPNQPPS